MAYKSFNISETGQDTTFTKVTIDEQNVLLVGAKINDLGCSWR